ncbi:unnamed protein product [Orchesella dallaii]|uniref:Toll-interacting protein n=1 Tax=Orchesella dallaii TaxID=48710 RepID=A0ABP1QAR0_9HEXA
MAASLDPDEAKRMDRRSRAMLGELPPDFLRLGIGERPAGAGDQTNNLTDPNTGLPLTQQQIQERLDEQAALALFHQLNAQPAPRAHYQAPVNVRGRLLISVMQAKLVKNYGMTRMDPYVRLHVGHNIYETPTDVNGARNPKWNKTIQCFLPNGINQIYMEIYDECNFSVDELIAHAKINIPDEIFKGETSEEWYPLSGKQGDGKEGQILLVFSFMAAPAGPPSQNAGGFVPYTGPAAPAGKQHPHKVYLSNQPVNAAVPQEVNRPTFNEDDFKQLKEMFPNMDEEVVRSVYEAAGFDKDASVNALLQMCE